MQSAIFSPFSWPAYVLPFWWSLGLIGGAEAVGAGVRDVPAGAGARAGRGGALLAGVVVGFGLFHVSGSRGRCRACGRGCRGCCCSPTTSCGGRRARRSRRSALVVALQYFGGHPETSFHVLAVAVLFALLPPRAPVAPRLARRAPGARAGRGHALAAVVLLPFVELLRALVRPRDPRGARAGHGRVQASCSRSPCRTTGAARRSSISEPFIVTRACYAGALPLMLAVVGAAARRARERVAVAAAGAVALLVRSACSRSSSSPTTCPASARRTTRGWRS